MPTQLGKHFWPSFSFVLGQRIDYLSPTVYLTDILAFFFIFFSLWKKPLYFPSSLAFLLVFLAGGIYFSTTPLVGWYGYVKLLECVLLGFSFKNFFLERTHWNLFFSALLINVFVESLLAIAQFINHGSLGGIFYYFGERSFYGSTPGIANVSVNGQLLLRPYATFSHPNVLAGFLLISMTLLVFFLSRLQKRSERALVGVTLFVGTIALLLSFSRLAIVIWPFILIGSGAFLLTRKEFHKEVGTIFILFFLLLTMFLGALTFPSILSHLLQFSFSDESVAQRVLLSGVAWKMFLQNPLFGVGFYNFLERMPSFIPTSSINSPQPVHNIFLLILSQTGLIGLVYFLWFLIKSYRHLVHIYKRAILLEKENVIVAGTLVMIILILGQVDHYFFTLQQGQLLTVLVFGFVFGITKKNVK